MGEAERQKIGSSDVWRQEQWMKKVYLLSLLHIIQAFKAFKDYSFSEGNLCLSSADLNANLS